MKPRTLPYLNCVIDPMMTLIKRRVRNMRKALVVAVVLVLLVVSGVSVAYATTATGTQNPDLTVFISLEPSCVKAGDTIVRQYSIKNNTSKSQTVAWKWEVTLNGQRYSIYPDRPQFKNKNSGRIQLGPGETWGEGPTTFTIYDFEDKGTYAITLSATNKKGTSSATAQYENYETTCSLGT